MEELFTFLTEYTEFFEKMEDTQQEKLELLLSGDLKKIEQSIMVQQAMDKQLENKERRLMEIMECEILGDGTRRFRPLFQYRIQENRVENGSFVITGEHRQVNPISESLARRLMENGMPQTILERLTRMP